MCQGEYSAIKNVAQQENGLLDHRKSPFSQRRFREWYAQKNLTITEPPLTPVIAQVLVETLKSP